MKKIGGHHTCSPDIHHSIFMALLHYFQCENDVFCNKNDNCQKLPTIFLNNAAWNKILSRAMERGQKIEGYHANY